MNRAAWVLLIVGIVLIPAALTLGGFNGISMLGTLAVTASIALTIIGAPSRRDAR